MEKENGSLQDNMVYKIQSRNAKVNKSNNIFSSANA